MVTALAMESASPSRLKRACEHVSRLWLPVNGSVLKSIRSALNEGRYNLGLQFLVEDLSQDISLLLFCMRELSHELTRLGVQQRFDSPLALFEAVGLDRIRAVLNTPLENISPHSFQDENSPQIRRLESILISAATASILAQRDEQDVEAAKLTAILRQIGHALIAWNYPSVYSRAITRRNRSLDKTLSEILGFTPLLLACSVVESWGIAPHIRLAAYGEESLTPQEKLKLDEMSEQSSYLNKLCEIGEALARANDPAAYPSAMHDWTAARKVIGEALGDNALQSINSKIKEFSRAYRALLPRSVAKDTPFDPDAKLHRFASLPAQESEKLFETLSSDLKSSLEVLYARISTGISPHESLEMLIKSILPQCAFSGVIVYTYEPQDKTLVPRLKTGAIHLRQLRAIPLNGISERPDPITVAWECSAPLRGAGDSGGHFYITATLGNTYKAGVLYCETAHSSDTDPDDILKEFKAIRKALADCLRL